MELSDRKEQFSTAYLQAVSSVAGYGVWKPGPGPDDDSVDWVVAQKGGEGTIKSPRLEVQMKCTAAPVPNGEHFSFPLKLKTYNDLRSEKENLLVPRILVVILVPDDVGFWLEQSEERLSMRRCGYWISLRGRGEVENTTSVTVRPGRTHLRRTLLALLCRESAMEIGHEGDRTGHRRSKLSATVGVCRLPPCERLAGVRARPRAGICVVFGQRLRVGVRNLVALEARF